MPSGNEEAREDETGDGGTHERAIHHRKVTPEVEEANRSLLRFVANRFVLGVVVPA